MHAREIFSLDEECAVVVGGTGVLGGAMAQSLAEVGARVAVVGRNRERGEARVRSIEAVGGIARFHAADALDAEGLRAVLAAIQADWGAPSVLINAAGGNRSEATLPPGADFCGLNLDAWRDVFDLNLVGGAVLPSQIFGGAMVAAGRGSIINIASLSGILPLTRVVAYSAAKAAVINFTQFLSREWAPKGVRVNAISPGFFPAEQNRRLLFREDGSYSERGAQVIGHTPLERFGEPSELAGAAIFLASSKASSFVTGHNLVVDGGFTIVAI